MVGIGVQTRSKCALTLSVFAPGRQHCTLAVASIALHMLHMIDICEIFECANLKFMVYGCKQLQASIGRYTHERNALSLVWGLAQ